MKDCRAICSDYIVTVDFNPQIAMENNQNRLTLGAKIFIKLLKFTPANNRM